MTTTKITDHAAQADARLVEQDKEKPNISALLSAFATPSQATEDALWQLFTERTIDVATGAQLDSIGVIVGRGRNGLSDDDYRRALQAQIAANNSEGTVSDLLKVIVGVVNDVTITVVVQQFLNASIEVRAEGGEVSDVTAKLATDLLLASVAAGVKSAFFHSLTIDDDTLTLAQTLFLDGVHGIGVTTLNLTENVGADTAWPATGSIVLDRGQATEETIAYSAKVGSTFTVAATAFAHADGGEMQRVESGTDKGLGDIDDLTIGGQIVSAKDQKDTQFTELLASLKTVKDVCKAMALADGTTAPVPVAMYRGNEASGAADLAGSTFPLVDVNAPLKLQDSAEFNDKVTHFQATFSDRMEVAVADATDMDPAVDKWAAIYVFGDYTFSTAGNSFMGRRASAAGNGWHLQAAAGGALQAGRRSASGDVVITDASDVQGAGAAMLRNVPGTEWLLRTSGGTQVTGTAHNETIANAQPFQVGKTGTAIAQIHDCALVLFWKNEIPTTAQFDALVAYLGL